MRKVDKSIINVFGLDAHIKLAALKIKEYPKFTLYQIFRIIGEKYIILYKTTLQKSDMKRYEVIEVYE